MKTIRSIKRVFLVGFMALIGATAFAQRVHNGHITRRGHHHPYVTRVVARPVMVTKVVSNKLSKNDRLNMALAYLRTYSKLSISKYGNMTGLSKLMAEAELDAFAMSKKNPIKMVIKGKKKYYILA